MALLTATVYRTLFCLLQALAWCWVIETRTKERSTAVLLSVFLPPSCVTAWAYRESLVHLAVSLPLVVCLFVWPDGGYVPLVYLVAFFWHTLVAQLSTPLRKDIAVHIS